MTNICNLFRSTDTTHVNRVGRLENFINIIPILMSSLNIYRKLTISFKFLKKTTNSMLFFCFQQALNDETQPEIVKQKSLKFALTCRGVGLLIAVKYEITVSKRKQKLEICRV